jgi:large subunit ribosomal protein L21
MSRKSIYLLSYNDRVSLTVCLATPYNGAAMDYAVVKTGGKQYRVRPGDVIDVEKLEAEVGSTINLEPVLLMSKDGDVTIGTPTVENVRVKADVHSHGRGDKIIVFKYKPKVRYRRKQGHRQWYTRLSIKEIVEGDEKKPISRVRKVSKTSKTDQESTE